MGEKIYVGVNVSQYFAVIFQPDLIFKWIQIGLAILVSLVALAYKIWVWYKQAKKDNMITLDDIENLFEETHDDVKHIAQDSKDLIDDIKKNK